VRGAASMIGASGGGGGEPTGRFPAPEGVHRVDRERDEGGGHHEDQHCGEGQDGGDHFWLISIVGMCCRSVDSDRGFAFVREISPMRSL
jgi:hypothetical protein